MTSAREYSGARSANGPWPVRLEEIDAINTVFSDAFTERYRRDGMVGVRVPALNPAIWRYAIEDADGGAMVWRGDGDEIVAFNVAHHSGIEGWMGPLAVHPEWQSSGIGKEIVRTGIRWLRERGARVIGLETMPRTMDNIGFYSRLGFVPTRLTVTLTLDAAISDPSAVLLGRLSDAEQERAIAASRALTERQLDGYDFSREIRLTEQLALGDTALMYEGSELRGFALFHTVPLVEGRAREELRVLKMVLDDSALIEPMAQLLCDVARRSGTKRVAIRVQGEYESVYRRLVALGGRVRWTDLRMCVDGASEPRAHGVVLSNWEI